MLPRTVRASLFIIVVALLSLVGSLLVPLQVGSTLALGSRAPGAETEVYPGAAVHLAANPDSPAHPVKLIFIHHSTGGNWLADPNEDQPYGGLGRALMDNNYFVSATNYGWGPDQIGSNTDIPNWPVWFTGPNRDTILAALLAESDQHICNPTSPSDDCFGAWPRLASDPGGENQIVMFKSCFPNSDLGGNPDDPPASTPNEDYTVANAKAVYNDLLAYFATRQDKLFVVITAPPLMQGDTSAEHALNARAFNTWLVNTWLAGYAHRNVAVFDYYNVLTSNGGDVATNDAGAEAGNHHRWWNGAVQHLQTVNNNYAAYPSGDSHPTTAGHQKATEEFVPLLNVAYHRWQSDSPPTDSRVYLPSILKQAASQPPVGDALVQPEDFTYLGAFRLPGDDADPPRTFAYGGNAMTFNPDGDSTNTDAFGGSLFLTGHDRTDTWLNGSQFAEIAIPVPVNSRNVDDLPYADLLQGFANVTDGHFVALSTVPKVGMQYLAHPDTGPRLHLTWGQHLQQREDFLPSQAWINPDLAHPDFQGEWFIGDQNPNSVNGYLFDLPTDWADLHVQGRYLATGRFSPGGLGGMGPALIAYRPWLAGGVAPVSRTHLLETPLLIYESAMQTSVITRSLNNYQHADAWEGGAWLTTPSGNAAVLFAGTKATGSRYWYGYIHPTDPSAACVDMDVIGDFWPCRLANGDECPASEVVHCCTEGVDCVSARGWWSTRFDAQLILYDPGDLAAVAAGTLQAWEPQPYAVLDIDPYLYFAPPEWDVFELGWGDQRRNRIGDVAFDRQNGYLYVLELYGDGAMPMVHVWRVQ